jgi:hypothetical protein
MRSARPRKAITIRNVTISDLARLQPSAEWNQTNGAGLVISATAVATLVRRRQSSPSSEEADVRSRSPGSAWSVAIA